MIVKLWAAIASAIFALLLTIVIIGSFSRKPIVTPVVHVGPPASASGAPAAEQLLAQRSRLQEENTVADGRRSATVADETSAGRLSMTPGVPDGASRVGNWLNEGDRSIVQTPAYTEGRASLPYAVSDVLVQPQGREFRNDRNNTVRWAGGWLIFGTGLALALFLLGRGRIEIVEGESGQTLERFGPIERGTHWMTASAFLIMAVTGLIIQYGRAIFIPLIGDAAFGTLASWSAWVHMASTVPFMLGVIAMIVMWVGGNLPERLDWVWLKQFGGFLRHDGKNPPARRFNAGQKLVFWSVVLGGTSLFVTGLVLMFPFRWFGYVGMQRSQLIHASLGLVMVAVILGHIYIGTIGMVGAFQAMWSGLVDRNWAKEHHRLWYDRQIEPETEVQSSSKERPRSRHVATFTVGIAFAVALAVMFGSMFHRLNTPTEQVSENLGTAHVSTR
jgi:formate dehydrogenase subunit gamma